MNYADCTVGKELALHVINAGLIPDITYDPKYKAGMIPGHRSMNNHEYCWSWLHKLK